MVEITNFRASDIHRIIKKVQRLEVSETLQALSPQTQCVQGKALMRGHITMVIGKTRGLECSKGTRGLDSVKLFLNFR